MRLNDRWKGLKLRLIRLVSPKKVARLILTLTSIKKFWKLRLSDSIGTKKKLEIALRLLENDILKPEKLMQIKDDLEYYLESNQEYDFMEDDTLYDDLNLNVRPIFGA
ncbi:GQ67_05292T0 [Komagataella phaffii]|nr:GQ67_05292T0 [Komagataella phaffii]